MMLDCLGRFWDDISQCEMVSGWARRYRGVKVVLGDVGLYQGDAGRCILVSK